MQACRWVKIRRLTVWFCINLVIFLACYLNYLLQLKHRYLYRILNVGLCLSRAAAMVINFNLLLVWLPMCKYSLTRLAYLTGKSLKQQREQYLNHQVAIASSSDYPVQLITASSGACENIQREKEKFNSIFRTKLTNRFISKFKVASQGAILQFRLWVTLVKLNSFSSFLVAVDNCKSLHTICATTITIASVIHTIAHLINVVNFSRNFDPLLNNLNMAEYKGQNPIHLLISVPGITGLLMMFILILMSLSSVDFIRNSCYDLFQIFHRLSIIFVVLLILHPSSHVIKEQSNVNRHNPELCYNQIVVNTSLPVIRELSQGPANLSCTSGSCNNSANHFVGIKELQLNHRQVAESASTLFTTSAPHTDSDSSNWQYTNSHQANNHDEDDRRFRRRVNASISIDLTNSNSNNNNNNIRHENSVIDFLTERQKQPLTTRSTNYQANLQDKHANQRQQEIPASKIRKGRQLNSLGNGASSTSSCLDSSPLFVAQSSVCWYVLSIGLSCYVLDLLLRKLRRSKSSIELLDVRLDCEDNLIELILNSNHKRFSHWLPGQFVYLNCPQIATYEWHPFTISSMDNRSGQFTLHIKTSGDWTRKLRERLECMQNSMSLLNVNGQRQTSASSSSRQQVVLAASPGKVDQNNLSSPSTYIGNLQLEFKSEFGKQLGYKQVESSLAPYCVTMATKHKPPTLPNLDCYNKMGQLQIECIKLIRINHEQDESNHSIPYHDRSFANNITTSTTTDQGNYYSPNPQELYSISYPRAEQQQQQQDSTSTLDLYIDGPFHSPFERLLEQEVSVCIANGVGWTAFSSMFQGIASNFITSYENTAKELREYCQCNYIAPPSFNSTTTNIIVNSTATTKHHQIICNIHGAESLSSSSSSSTLIRKLSNTKLHLMVIVTSVEQLRPFYSLACDYFNQIQDEYQVQVGDQLNPVKEITAFLTRSSKDDPAFQEFCHQENLMIANEERENPTTIVKINDLFSIRFGKPKFDDYLSAFGAIYQHKSKISVYCCGSSQVKKEVREICQNLNRVARLNARLTHQKYLSYSYHEENF